MRYSGFAGLLLASFTGFVAYGTERIENEIAASDARIAAEQAKLADRCRLEDYRALVKTVAGEELWGAALQKALDEHEIVVIPPRKEPYFIAEPVLVPSDRRIEATGATVKLAKGVTNLMLRTASAADGTLKPVPAGTRARNIAVVGGTWADNSVNRRGYGTSGRFGTGVRRHGNFFGISTLFYFGNVDHVSVRDATFVNCGGFAVQCGEGDGFLFERIRFDDCFADGLHLNGNLTRVHAKDIRGKVGDDLVALNAYDWLDSSVNFGPQRWILCEDLELILKDGKGYPAIRILPASFRYADGTIVDCAINDVIFRRVKGILNFKLYLQTPRYVIGNEPEWSKIGTGGNIHFEDIEMDLTRAIDGGPYCDSSDRVRGHFAAFEIGANLSSVHFKNIDITFHGDRYPFSHLVTVGPKSMYFPAKDGKPAFEVFDPYLSCEVGRLVLENIRTHGTVPHELVHETAFDDVNGDGRSTGRGRIGRIEARFTAAGLRRPVRLFVAGDTHFALHDGRDDAYADNYRRMAQWPAAKAPFERMLAAAKTEKADALVLLGDILSFPTAANVEYVHGALERSGLDYAYIAGNHDWHFEGDSGSDLEQRSRWIGKRLGPLYRGDNPLMYSRMVGALRLVMIDNSAYHVLPEQVAFWKAEAAKGDPVVLCMHVPFWQPGYPIDTCANPEWGAAKDENWRIERRERWAERSMPSTFEFREAVYSTPNLVAILAGHEHTLMYAVDRGRPQLVVPSNIRGRYLELEVKPSGFPERGLCGHGGDLKDFPEDTIEGVKGAIAKGVAMVEFDVQRCRSGEFICMHDGDLSTTTTVTGNTWQSTFEHIRSGTIKPKRWPKFGHVRVPTFDEMIDALPREGVLINVHCYGDANIGRDLALKIKEKGRIEQAYIACSLPCIRKAREAVPEIRACNMTRPGPGNRDWTDEENMEYLRASIENKCQYLQLRRRWSRRFSDLAHQAGIKVNYCPANCEGSDPGKLEELFALGFDYVFCENLAACQPKFQVLTRSEKREEVR